MLNELDVLRDVTERLDRLGIEFMLTGSMAMVLYSVPRMTRDLDLVVSLKIGHERLIFEHFEPDYYIPHSAVRSAIARRSMFNLIHQESIMKVDFVVLKEAAFRVEEFARRRRVAIAGFETWVVSREDLILSKLVWAKDSRSELQLRDVANLLKAECDFEFLAEQAARLDVAKLYEEIRSTK
jgi:hypothetical protein